MFSCFFKKRRFIKRLWKLRRAYIGLDEKENNFCQQKSDQEKQQRNTKIRREFVDFKRLFYRILTNFDVSQLDILLNIILSEGSTIGDCILIDVDHYSNVAKSSSSSTNLIQIDDEEFQLTNFILKTFCQPELTSTSVISPLPWCRKLSEEVKTSMVCVNPYHFGILHANDVDRQRRSTYVDSRVVDIESSTTSSSGCCDLNYVSDTTGTCRTLCARHSSSAGANGLPNQRDWSSNRRKRAWCHMAYWERDVRVGELLSVADEPIAYCYFTLPVDLPATNSLDLGKFFKNNLPDRTESTCRTRQKIGRGFVLYINSTKKQINDDSTTTHLRTTDDDVLLHNRGPSTLFVRSNYLHKEETAVRLQPGYTLLVHRFDCDDENFTSPTSTSSPNLVNYRLDGPQNPPSVLISFSKCWGKNYSRTFITCCPCWVEVIFAR